ncbi:MarR family transcriptional regulator [Oceanobacillus arenosus]|uniref:MarR family transcriptional regulator n=1 Tax=Oceanobacillus arenosus TaxID=1229153 RepID=A0A3D8PLN1_9BACI|nr:MarR family transcriptional regulator [Oceanobacillus arenosus]RDW16139.1 MarR family transcriptional regulator [Oceanobacillus arenosus]
MNNSGEYNRDSDLSLKLLVVLTRALESIEKQIVKNIKSYKLNLTEFAVLEVLFHKGDMPIQKIGQKILLATSSITYVVDKLENKNYVKRVASPTDRRVIHATITKEGKALMAEIFPKHKDALTEIMGGVDVSEKEWLVEHLKRLGLHAKNL